MFFICHAQSQKGLRLCYTKLFLNYFYPLNSLRLSNGDCYFQHNYFSLTSDFPYDYSFLHERMMKNDAILKQEIEGNELYV